MGKPNTYVQLLNAQKQIVALRYEVERMKGFTLHNAFGFGPERCGKFEEEFRKTFLAYARMCVEDGADDEEIVYTKEKVDRALRAACGPDVLPFDERYAEENLYFRAKDLKEERNAE